MLASDPVFKKVYEALERHDSRVTIVTTKSLDSLSTTCAVAAINATCAIYINGFEYQRALGVTNCFPQYSYGLLQSRNSTLRIAKRDARRSLVVAKHPIHTILS